MIYRPYPVQHASLKRMIVFICSGYWRFVFMQCTSKPNMSYTLYSSHIDHNNVFLLIFELFLANTATGSREPLSYVQCNDEEDAEKREPSRKIRRDNKQPQTSPCSVCSSLCKKIVLQNFALWRLPYVVYLKFKEWLLVHVS